MAFSGITMACLADELNRTILNGKIQKISQPEANGIIIGVHSDNGNHKLYISANPSLPLIYLTKETKSSPISAFNFVMVLRKHVGNARIIRIEQLGLERVICLTLEHLDELKDVAVKRLYVEIMGKYSNIIFTDDNNRIIDAIKHVGSTQSSVREVLPGREYFTPAQSERMDALATGRETFYNKVLSRNTTVEKAISSSFVGFSKLTGMEIANRIGLDGAIPLQSLHETEKEALWQEFDKLVTAIKDKSFSPQIVYGVANRSLEFSAFNLSLFAGEKKVCNDSISNIIFMFYERKNNDGLIKQKATDLKKIVTNHIERANKKLEIQKKQISDTEKMDKLRIYGELLQAYGYSVLPGEKSVTVENYYDDNKEITIPLDPEISAIENSKKYFTKYEKLKRTKEATLPLLEKTRTTIEHLKTIAAALLVAENEEDISAVKDELYRFGYIKKRPENTKKKEKKSSPLHFKTPEGFDLYVGKNNLQNEEVTFKIARNEDWFFHAKTIPGSHVILKTGGKEVPDRVFELAANLAAYYSSARESDHVEVDYLPRKDVKRVNGAPKGFVIYYSNYSMVAIPDISSLSKEP